MRTSHLVTLLPSNEDAWLAATIAEVRRILSQLTRAGARAESPPKAG